MAFLSLMTNVEAFHGDLHEVALLDAVLLLIGGDWICDGVLAITLPGVDNGDSWFHSVGD